MKLSKSETTLAVARQGQEMRPCDTGEILAQIGAMTTLAVSGGRAVNIRNGEGETVGVLLPCGESRAVEVVLDWMDVYTVRRVRLVTRGVQRGSVVVESETALVYCDQLAEVVYSASCWK